MNVRFGIIYSPRDLEIDLGDSADAEEVTKEITAALAEDSGVLWLTDRKGKRYGVVTDKVSFVEVGSETEGRPVGFKA